MIFFLLIVSYTLLADIVAKRGETRRIGYALSFFLSIVLTPFFGFLITEASKSNNADISDNSDTIDVESGVYLLSMTRIVRIILCINILMFFFEIFAGLNGQISIINKICLNYGEGFAPYQFLTHLFVHAGRSHIYSNLSFLFLCGPYIERRIGEMKFLAMYLIAGIFGSILQITIASHSERALLGASGCVFAVITLFVLINNSHLPEIKWFKIKYFALPVILYELFTFLRVNDGIGHFSHIGGILIGVLFYFIFIWKRNRLKT